MAMTGCAVEPSSGSAGSSAARMANPSVTAPSPPVPSATLRLASAPASAPTSQVCIQTTHFPPDVPLVPPPPACIHGVAGMPASWCWDGCADGDPSGPEGLPLAVAPFEVTVPEGSRIASASAFLLGPDAHHYLEVGAAPR